MLKGIDVSHYEEFNWNDMKPLVLSKQLYFAYAKASDGLIIPITSTTLIELVAPRLDCFTVRTISFCRRRTLRHRSRPFLKR